LARPGTQACRGDALELIRSVWADWIGAGFYLKPLK